MKNQYQSLIESIDDLMIALGKQKKLGLDADVLKALLTVTRARGDFKRALNLRMQTQKKLNERTKL
jgi:hypothetical protein